MQELKVSIIVPVYNGQEYIEECMESIINQTYENIEIIIVNDGSKDNTQNIIEKYKNKDNRIIILKQDNKGVSVARNEGIKRATSEWLLFVDGDDILEKDAVENLTKSIDNDTDLIVSKVIEEGQKYEWQFKENKKFTEAEKSELIKSVFYENQIGKYNHASNNFAKLYRNTFIEPIEKEKQSYFVEGVNMGEDVLFNIPYYANARKIAFCNCYTYNYRWNTEGATKKYNPDIIKEYDNFLTLLKEILIKENIYEKYEKDYQYYVLRKINTFFRKYFFAKENNAKFFMIKKEIIEMTKKEPYHTAIYNSKNMKLPRKRRIMVKCLKSKWFRILKYMYQINKELKNENIYESVSGTKSR